MLPKCAHFGKLRKVTTFFSYMQARAFFFIFFIKSVKAQNGQKKE